ncbi:hypothetical protein [Pseudenhygromyxa sp. WMMC2535]|uniref:hypothetical protein n=1 Tax=Pseudenhygromyxa sp. WMMC2535 TaxID=2712867 RepID=UPI001C3D5E59|nr:hypothetical protein [Pseudenhygromyxa sp. WMMC2535]
MEARAYFNKHPRRTPMYTLGCVGALSLCLGMSSLVSANGPSGAPDGDFTVASDELGPRDEASEDGTAQDDADAQPMAASEATVSAYSATWTYADGGSGRDEVRAAIERATEDMDLVSGKVARERLEDGLIPKDSDTIAIAMHSDSVDLNLSGCPGIQGAQFGEWVSWTCDGESFRTKHVLGEKALTQWSKSDAVQIKRRYVVDGDKLTLHFKLSHGKIPEAVHFSLHYSR